ncbi:MAG: hypothetical protein Q8S18_01450 [Bacteroidales bacterium]|nr:hypothetical protein [Bacteroidales bacterium]
MPRRVASFLIPTSTDSPPAENEPKTALVSSFLINKSGTRPFQVIPEGIVNDHEPLNSSDPPSPSIANYYRSDDYVYHYVNGLWKRIPIHKFI